MVLHAVEQLISIGIHPVGMCNLVSSVKEMYSSMKIRGAMKCGNIQIWLSNSAG